MKDFKQLVQEGYVSRCGRWIKSIPHDFIFYWYLNKYGSMCESRTDQTTHAHVKYQLKYGGAFYSKEHAELARDTMEAEQICRKLGVDFYSVVNGMRAVQEIYEGSFPSALESDELLKRFSSERLTEILNQELKEDNE